MAWTWFTQSETPKKAEKVSGLFSNTEKFHLHQNEQVKPIWIVEGI